MIIFQEVSKEFGPEDFALREVSFSVEPGELVFITGASGSGKTTLMRLLTKEATPTQGEIQFGDQVLSKIKASAVHTHRRKIGVVFQDYRLLPELNVWENVALPLFVSGQRDSEVEERVTDLLRLVQLTHKSDLFPSQLSGGEAQRISIARALASGPEVIFADEPTGNLDSETAQHIADLLIKINELGTTVLFATHDHRFLESYPKHHRLHLEEGALIIDSSTVSATAKTEGNSEKSEAKRARGIIAAAQAERKTSSDSDNKSSQDTNTDTKSKTTTTDQPDSQLTDGLLDDADLDTLEDEEGEDSQDTKQQLKKPSFWQRLFGKKSASSVTKHSSQVVTKSTDAKEKPSEDAELDSIEDLDDDFEGKSVQAATPKADAAIPTVGTEKTKSQALKPLAKALSTNSQELESTAAARSKSQKTSTIEKSARLEEKITSSTDNYSTPTKPAKKSAVKSTFADAKKNSVRIETEDLE